MEQVKEYLAERTELNQNFQATKKVEPYIYVDENQQCFRIDNEIFKFSDLMDYELMEDESTVTKHRGGGASLLGGVLFRGRSKSKDYCTSLKVVLALENAHRGTVNIKLITSKTKVSSNNYEYARANANKCMAVLDSILDSKCQEPVASTSSPALSGADEILKYKQLFDAGIISQEEFEAKKKQLLGL